jgi:hypothetical protein
MTAKPTKHFLDTTVVRSMLLGGSAYKKYFTDLFGEDNLYTSKYVQMEFKRSYLRNVIAIYYTFHLPTVKTISDVISLWTNKFETSKRVAAGQLAAGLLRNQQFNFTRASDKPRAIEALAKYIVRLEIKLRRMFIDIGKDSTRCARSAIPLKVKSGRFRDGFDKFTEDFDDTDLCRSKCRIDTFFLVGHSQITTTYINLSRAIPKRNNEGFIGVSEALEKIVSTNGQVCTCGFCGKVGDAVITLDAPRNMQLEHTDKSFEQLCPPLGQPHRLLKSEISVVEKQET